MAISSALPHRLYQPLLPALGRITRECEASVLVWDGGWYRGFGNGIPLGPLFNRRHTNLTGYWPDVVFVGLIVWEAVVFGGWCALVAWMVRIHSNLYWLAAPSWVLLEYFWPRVFTWALAHSHSEFLPVLQIAELGGTSAVSSVLILAACGVTALISRERQQRRAAVAAIAVVGLVLLAGLWRIEQVESQLLQTKQLRVAALQVDPTFVESTPHLQSRSAALDDQVDLIVWPETSIGHYHESLTHFRDPIQVSELSEAPNPAEDPTHGLKHAWLLAGGKVYREGHRNTGPYLNTAFLISPAKDIIDRYVKRSLMPIGEYIPLGEQFPILKHLAAITTPLVPGDSDEPVRLPAGPQVGTLICYEDMERENSRRTTLCGAQCLVVLINGSGFEDEDALRQHQRLALLRTIENRRAMLRCGATGLTCMITPTGRVEQQLPMFTEGQIVTSVPLLDQQTLYCQFGEWFTWFSAASVLVGVSVALLRSRVTQTVSSIPATESVSGIATSNGCFGGE